MVTRRSRDMVNNTQRRANKTHFQRPGCCAIAICAQAVRQRSKVFITIDVRIHNKKWWLNLLQPVLFKAELLSPSCCSLCLHFGGGGGGEERLWWLMHSLLGSRAKRNLEFLLKCFTHVVVIHSLHRGTTQRNNASRIEKSRRSRVSATCAAALLERDEAWCLRVSSGMSLALFSNSSFSTCSRLYQSRGSWPVGA